VTITCDGFIDAPLTCCRNCSLKPARLGFFSLGGTGGAAAAAAAAKVGSPDGSVGHFVPGVDSVSDADDDSSFVVDDVDDVSLPVFFAPRNCLSFFKCLDDTQLESSISTSNCSFLNAMLDDMIHQ
jgi:hypothetical protein